MGESPKEVGEVDIGSRHETQGHYRKQKLVYLYCTISRAFMGIPGIIVSYSFPLDPLRQNTKKSRDGDGQT